MTKTSAKGADVSEDDKINWTPNFTAQCDKYFMTFVLWKNLNIRLHIKKKHNLWDHLIDSRVKLEIAFKEIALKILNALKGEASLLLPLVTAPF